jgi:hypothetical protein
MAPRNIGDMWKAIANLMIRWLTESHKRETAYAICTKKAPGRFDRGLFDQARIETVIRTLD